MSTSTNSRDAAALPEHQVPVEPALPALRRAALQARRTAQQTGTDVIVVRAGLLVRLPPSMSLPDKSRP